jgi:hypothetical protein
VSYWQIIRRGTFRFYWFPGVQIGIYRVQYDGWHLAMNFGIFALEWSDAW